MTLSSCNLCADQYDPDELRNLSAELISNASSVIGGVVNITWDPPTIPEEFSSVVRVLSYVVTVLNSEASGEVIQEVTVAAGVTWVVVPRLDWGSRYAFIIRVSFSSFSNLGPPSLGRIGPLPPGAHSDKSRHDTCILLGLMVELILSRCTAEPLTAGGFGHNGLHQLRAILCSKAVLYAVDGVLHMA